MIRKLLATTALASLVATGAFAQDAANPAASPAAPAATDQNTGAMQPEGGAMNAAPAADTAAPAGDSAAMSGSYLQALGADQHLASDIDDVTLYQSNAQDAQSAGEMENLVIGQDGRVVAAVIETAGLDDNKTVAVPFDKIQWSMGQNNEPRAVLTATREELQAAPEFTSQSAREAANTGAMAPGTGTVASGAATTGGAPAVGTDSASTGAMAPGNTDMAAGTATPPAATGDANAMSSGAMGSQNGYLASLGSDQHLADDIVGANVYSGPGQDAQTIGSVNDLVIDKSGKVAAAIVGVGGFLGIGEKNVGVPYEEISMNAEANSDEPRLVLAATKEQLTAAPTFEDRDDQATAANTAATGTTDTGAMGTAAGAGAAAGAATGMAANNAATTGGAAMGTDTNATASTGGNDRSSMTAVTGPELTADNLKGTTVYGPNDQSIGSVGDIALTAEGQVDAIIVDVGGFLGIGAKPVAVSMDNLQFMRDSNGRLNVYTQFTEDQLKNAPEFNRDTYAENRSTMRLESGSAPAAGTTTTPAQ